MVCYLRQYLPPLPSHQHGRRPSVEYDKVQMGTTFAGIWIDWMTVVGVDASMSTDEAIVDIGFNCDASSISTSPPSTFSSSSISKDDVSVE